MINLITINAEGHKVARRVTNREEYIALRNAEPNVANWRAARAGDADSKPLLLQFNYNDQLPDGVLRGCHTMASTFAHDIDCRSQQECLDLAQRIIALRQQTGLLELSTSVNWGLHVVCRCQAGKTILENQVDFATITHTEMDCNTHDQARVLFTGPADAETLLYLDDSIFAEPLTPQQGADEFKRLKQREQRGEEQVPPGAKKANKHYRPWEEVVDTPVSALSQGSAGNPPITALPSERPSDRVRFIARGVMKEKGLVESDFLVEGARHTSVKILLSGAAQLLTKGELNAVLQELMPQHWCDANIQQLVNNFYQNYTNPSNRLLRYQEELFTKSRRLSADEEGTKDAQQPPMPRRLPALIKLLTSRTPEGYKAAVAQAVFPPLATHLCGVRFNYTDNVEHEATLMHCLMAVTGAGKGCIDEPIARIMADIKRRDEENTRREAEWKKDCQRKGANKDKLPRPEGLVIQIIDPDMTKPALVTRMEEADGHFVYVKLNELDLFEQLKGYTGKQHFQLMCLAFDPGATYGQTRVGTQSVTARPFCRFNWNACTTILKGRRFFSRVLTDGPISRITFSTIPEREIGCPQPVYGKYDDDFEEALRPYIVNLTAARGLIDCPQAFRLAKKLQLECAEFARLSQSETYWNLSHRACVIAWLKACVLYVANGQRWEPTIEAFVRWSLQDDLFCKMAFFGADIEKANSDEGHMDKPGPRNLLELLPDVFTLDDARRVRQQQGMCAEKTNNMVATWKKRHYVVQMADGSYQKSKTR